MVRTTFQPKDPSEKISLPFDFTADLGTASIASTTTTLAIDAGTDGATLAANGSAVIAGGLVYTPVKDGTHLCDYTVKVAATTSDGRVLVLAGLLPVRNA